MKLTLKVWLLLPLALTLAACAPGVESKTPDAPQPPGFEEKQKALQDGLASERLALQNMNFEFVTRVNTWKAMPLKSCSVQSLVSEDPMTLPDYNGTNTYSWDVRTLYNRTQGTLLATTADYYFAIEARAGGVIETENVATSKVLSTFSERTLNGGTSIIELRQGVSNCFLVVDGRLAYRTALVPSLSVTLYSNLNPVVLSKIGTGKIGDSILPHKTTLTIQRDLFPYRAGLGMKLDSRIPAAFFRGDFVPRRPPEDAASQFLNFFNPLAARNLPAMLRTLKLQDPALTHAGITVSGSELKTLAVADQGRMTLPIGQDPFAAASQRFDFNFKGPAFYFGFYANNDRRVQIRYALDFIPTSRTGTEIRGDLVSAGGQLESLTPAKQSACLSEILRVRPFDTSADLTTAQVTDACKNVELDNVTAFFQEGYVATMLAIFKDRAALQPRIGDTFVTETTRLILNRFGHEALPGWWKAQNDWRFQETAKANDYLLAQVAKYPVIEPALLQIIAATAYYNSVLDGRRFNPQALDKMLFVVVRLEKSGLPLQAVVNAYQPTLWQGMGENEINLFLEGVSGMRESDKIAALQNPQAIVQRVVAEKKEAARKSDVQRRAQDFAQILAGLSPELQKAAKDVALTSTFSTFADRASLNQLRQQHTDRVNRTVQTLKSLGPDTRLDPVALELMTDLRTLFAQDLTTEYAFVESILKQSAQIILQYKELTQTLKEWTFAQSRERVLQWAASTMTVEVIRHLNARRAELTAKTGLNLQELMSISMFHVEKGVIGGAADLSLLTDMIVWLGQEVQGGANFLRQLETSVGTVGAKILIVGFEDLKTINARILTTYQTSPRDRPYLNGRRLTLAVKSADEWESFKAQIDNVLTVIETQNKSCANIATCQQTIHDLLKMNLAGRVSTTKIDLTVLNAGSSIQALLGPGFEAQHAVDPKAVNTTQILSLIHGYGWDRFEQSLNNSLTRLTEVDVTAFLVNLSAELANPPSGTDRLKMMRTVFEEAVLNSASVLWNPNTDLAATTTELNKILKNLRTTTNKEKIKKHESELRSLLNV